MNCSYSIPYVAGILSLQDATRYNAFMSPFYAEIQSQIFSQYNRNTLPSSMTT